MLLTALHLAVLAAPWTAHANPPLPAQDPTPDQTVAGDHGKLTWFEGTWDELLAEARRTKRLVFVQFWADWCGWCKRMDRETFSDARVVEAMKDVLCFAVDKESKAAAPLVERYNVYHLPTLLFLEPDGRLRDCLLGYRNPRDFLAVLERVKRNEGTITSLESKVKAAPEDLALRYELALRLQKARDFEGFERQMAMIRKLDPEGKSLTSRRIELHEIVEKAARGLDPTPVYAFLEKGAEPELLFLAWRMIHKIEGDLLSKARGDARVERRRRWLVAARNAWAHVPGKYVGIFGNNLAWGIYEARCEVEREDLLFAIEVARKAVAARPEDANVIDTLACCLFAVGEKGEAIKLAKRCIELQPRNDGWKKRLADFLQ